MKSIIEWLISVEHSAYTFYDEATGFIPDDNDLTKLLKHLSADEAEHYHLMASALQYIESRPPKKSQIEIDESIKTKIESPFITATELLHNGLLTKNSSIDCIVESEFSEWNDLFDYVVNTLKTEDRIFAQAASLVEHHLRYIEHYLRTSKYGKDKLQAFRQQNKKKKEKILIVDDESAIAELLSALLEDICESDLAADGVEAMEKIKGNIYGLVISDVDMPKMNGIELYNNARLFFAKPNDMFVFHTGNLTDDLRCFFETNNLTYMEKPSSIIKIRNTVNRMFHLE